jgi:hypothetical protein
MDPDFPTLFMNPTALAPIVKAIEYAEAGIDLYSYVKRRKKIGFYKKIETFLKQLDKLTEDQKIEFHRKLKEDSTDFWNNVLQTLDKINGERKAAITGKLCEALILEFIDKHTFARLSGVIELIYIDDLEFFNKKYSKMPSTQELLEKNFIPADDMDKPKVYQLVNYGLLTDNRIVAMQHGEVPSADRHKPTELGMQLLNHGF